MILHVPAAVAIGAIGVELSPFVCWSSGAEGVMIGWICARASGKRRVRYSWEAFLYVLEHNFVGEAEDGA